jgi:DNA replication factor GINS
MNLDELRSAQAKERRKDSLQHLRDSFYDDVAAYVADLRAARDRRAEQVAKPFSDDDVRRLSDEVETAEEVAEALYERRVGKVVKLASFAAADMPVDADGMTTEERQLFDGLVDRISENKSRVLDVLSGEAPPTGDPGPVDPRTTGPADGPTPPEPTSDDEETASPPDGSESESTVDEAGALAGAMGGADDGDESTADPRSDPEAAPPEAPPESDDAAATGTVGTAAPADDGDGPTAVPPESAPPGAPGVTESDEPATAPDGPSAESGTDSDAQGDSGPSETALDDDRTTVRITRDVGAIFGVDEREYDLASEDVVTLPVENADPLVARDAAERLD